MNYHCYYTHDEIEFINRLASGLSHVRDPQNRADPQRSLKRYAELVHSGMRTFDPSIDVNEIKQLLTKLTGVKGP